MKLHAPTRALRLWRKAQGRSIRFLAWKAANVLVRRSRKYTRFIHSDRISSQFVARRFQSKGISSIRLQLLTREAPSYFVDQAEIPLVLRQLEERDATYRDRMIARAERILRHQVEILAVGEMNLGDRIDWNRDYRSGFVWEQRFVHDYQLVDFSSSGDVRITWELNRLHFLVDLGKAYRLCGDARYVHGFMALVADWDDSNPYESSINWTCAMDVGIRAVNLIWALTLMLPAQELHEHFLTRLIRMLIKHGRYVYRNLEYSDVRGNHYLSDLVGLIYLGLFLPEIPEAHRWLTFAVPRLEAEIFRQVFPDGVDHEGSIPYHRLVLELFYSSAELLRRNGRELSADFYRRLEKMAEFAQAYIKPDGACPMFGDGDDGRLHVLGTQPIADHRYLMSTCAVLFNRADFKASAGQFWEESAWLTGTAGWETFDHLAVTSADIASKAFVDGGYFFLRGGNDYVAIDCGDVGLRGRGGHGHCDVLSLEIALRGESVVIDRGCSLYTVELERRKELISARSHNTILVDGLDYARVIPYDIPSVQNTRCKLISWESSEKQVVFEAEHYGYVDLGLDVTHRRKLELDKRQNQLAVHDLLMGEGEHAVEVRFYLAPGCQAKVIGPSCEIETAQKTVIQVSAGCSDTGQWMVQPTTVFPRYGREVSSQLILWSGSLHLPAELRFRWTVLPTANCVGNTVERA